MYRVNIYTMTDIKGPRRRDGLYIYFLEMPTEKGPATLYDVCRIEDATENRAELTALAEALKRLNQNCELDIYTESAHIGTALESGITEWEHMPDTCRGTPHLHKCHEVRTGEEAKRSRG